MSTFKKSFPELPNITECDLGDDKIYGVLVSDEILNEFTVMHQVAKLKSIRYGVDFIKYNLTLEGLKEAVYPHATSGQGTNPDSEDACTLHVVKVDYDPHADNEHNVYFRSILYTRTTDMPQSAAARLAHAKYKKLCTTPCVSGTPLTVSQFLPNVDEFVTNTDKLYDSCKRSMATLKEETTWSLVELLAQYQAIVDESVLATPAIMNLDADEVALAEINIKLDKAVADLNAKLAAAAGDMTAKEGLRDEIDALKADIAKKDGEIAAQNAGPVAVDTAEDPVTVAEKDVKIAELEKELAKKEAEIDILNQHNKTLVEHNTSLTNENQMLQHQGNAAISAFNAELHELRTHYAWPDERINNLQTLLELPEDTLPTFEMIVKTTYATFPTNATVQLEMVDDILTRALSKKLITDQQAANFVDAARKAPTPPALISCLTELYDAIVATTLTTPAIKAEPPAIKAEPVNPDLSPVVPKIKPDPGLSLKPKPDTIPYKFHNSENTFTTTPNITSIEDLAVAILKAENHKLDDVLDCSVINDDDELTGIPPTISTVAQLQQYMTTNSARFIVRTWQFEIDAAASADRLINIGSDITIVLISNEYDLIFATLSSNVTLQQLTDAWHKLLSTSSLILFLKGDVIQTDENFTITNHEKLIVLCKREASRKAEELAIDTMAIDQSASATPSSPAFGGGQNNGGAAAPASTSTPSPSTSPAAVAGDAAMAEETTANNDILDVEVTLNDD